MRCSLLTLIAGTALGHASLASMFGIRLHRCHHGRHGRGQGFVFPKPDHLPASRLKRRVDALVAFHVPAKLGRPVPLVRRGLPAMLRADMPEAAVNEDSNLLRGEDDVGPDLDLTQVQPKVLAVAQSKAVQRATQGDLGFGIGSPVGLHVARPALVERRWIDAPLVGLLPGPNPLALSHAHPIGRTADGLLREDTATHRSIASSGLRKGSQ